MLVSCAGWLDRERMGEGRRPAGRQLRTAGLTYRRTVFPEVSSWPPAAQSLLGRQRVAAPSPGDAGAAGGRAYHGRTGGAARNGDREELRGLAVELLVGIVLSVILAVAVALAGGGMTTGPEPAAKPLIVPIIEETPQDLDPRDPRDPLVRCETFETHTRCVREAS